MKISSSALVSLVSFGCVRSLTHTIFFSCVVLSMAGDGWICAGPDVVGSPPSVSFEFAVVELDVSWFCRLCHVCPSLHLSLPSSVSVPWNTVPLCVLLHSLSLSRQIVRFTPSCVVMVLPSICPASQFPSILDVSLFLFFSLAAAGGSPQSWGPFPACRNPSTAVVF